MKHEQRQLLRLAQAIHRANAAPDKPAPLALPEEAWRNCQTLLRRRAQAHSRDWRAAAAQVQRGLKVSVRNLAEELTVCASVLEPPPATPFASPREIYHDLLALQDEFNELTWDRQERTLSVTTPAITLEGVRLGRFAITLRWPSLRPVRYGGYRITALDPHPAEKDEDVTHPHVQGEMLCEGEAHAAIQKALSQGRLLDFFLIVRSVLETYNSDSPYVALEEWEGARCDDCDGWIASDDASACSACDITLCSDCRSFCPGCDDPFCSRCLHACAGCQEDCCSGCLSACAGCGKSVCSPCLNSNHLCENCHDHEATNDPDPAVQPHSLGQAAVPA